MNKVKFRLFSFVTPNMSGAQQALTETQRCAHTLYFSLHADNYKRAPAVSCMPVPLRKSHFY